MSNNKCECCNAPGPFALYELRDDLTKIWRSNLCTVCDRRITRNNELLKKVFCIEDFKEVFISGK